MALSGPGSRRPTEPHRTSTALGRIGRTPARLALLGWSLFLATAVGMTSSPFSKSFVGKPSRGPGDVALYRAEVDRMQAGEGYYAAAATELRARGYPTKSVFNWRTPLPLWLIGTLPDPVFGKALLCALALAAVALCLGWLAREGGFLVALAGGLSLCGSMLPCFLGDLFVMPVLWSGFLMVMSLALLAEGRTKLGVTAGSAALFLRELAGPFAAVMLALALWRGRFREAAYWCLGLASYAVYFAWHVHQVNLMQGPTDRAQAEGWVQLGGLAFVVSTTQFNGWLLVAPQWLTALYLSLALLGFVSWRGSTGERAGLTAATYVLLFSLVGKDINQYWGSLIAPLLCLGFAWAAPALRDLWHAARGSSPRSTVSP